MQPQGGAPGVGGAGKIPDPIVRRRAPNSSRSPGRSKSKTRTMERIDSKRSTGSTLEYFRPDQTIILLDWDDTLCPSNWIREHRPMLNFFRPAPQDEKYQRPLRELQKQAEAVLTLALKLGKVIIVTNAMEPWVETSCKNFLPRLSPLVEQIPVVYARSVYDSCDGGANGSSRQCTPTSVAAGILGAGAAHSFLSAFGARSKLQSFNSKVREQQADAARLPQQKWKEVAFGMEISDFYSRYEHQSWKNVVSIGDSIFERDAVRRVVLNRPRNKKSCRTKTAKLLDSPDIYELIAQVKVIHDALGMMVQYDGNLDIEIDEEDLQMDLALADKIVEH